MKTCEWCGDRPATTVRYERLGRARFERSLDVCSNCAAMLDRDYRARTPLREQAKNKRYR